MGSLLLLSPCATGAAQSLLPAIAFHYGVGGAGVVWVNGIGGGAALALGALCSTFVPGNWDRRLTYAAAGVTNALAAIFLLAANQPAVYLAGTAFYLATEGLCAARGVALVHGQGTWMTDETGRLVNAWARRIKARATSLQSTP